MEHLSIDDFIRVEGHLSKKLDQACGEFKKLIVTKVCETFNGQPLSRDEFERIYRDARKQVEDIFTENCKLLTEFCPNSHPVILSFMSEAINKIHILHDLEWQILVTQLQ